MTRRLVDEILPFDEDDYACSLMTPYQILENLMGSGAATLVDNPTSRQKALISYFLENHYEDPFVTMSYLTRLGMDAGAFATTMRRVYNEKININA